MDKNILIQYADLQQEVKEVRNKINLLEDKIHKIENGGNVIDSVKGGEGGIVPYKIEGFPYPEYSRKKTLLYSRKATLQLLEDDLLEKTNEVEEFICTIDDSRMRRIVNLRIIEGLSWNHVADKIGGGNTEDSVRKSFARFMEK